VSMIVGIRFAARFTRAASGSGCQRPADLRERLPLTRNVGSDWSASVADDEGAFKRSRLRCPRIEIDDSARRRGIRSMHGSSGG